MRKILFFLTILLLFFPFFLSAQEEPVITIKTDPPNSQVTVYEWTPLEGNKGDIVAKGISPLRIPEENITKNRGIVIVTETIERGFLNSEQTFFSPYKFLSHELKINLQKEVKAIPIPPQEESKRIVPIESSRQVEKKQAEIVPQQSQATDTEEIVYITRTGSKYHRASCRYLSKSMIPISLKDAKARGYTPCSVCQPPR
jgi:hypothetical protein